MTSPAKLRCEYREEPIGIDVARPRLSWVPQPSDQNARGVRQTAYQVVVREGEQTLWNSQKVKSCTTFQAAYDGPVLKSAQRLAWKVRIWDSNDRPSPWSEVATWTMGPLSADDWQAHWIGAASEPSTSKVLPLFRRFIRLDQTPARAIAFICGLGQHELRINGRKVGDDVLSPGWTNYRETCLYLAHDVTSLLQAGENVIAVMLGNGMYNVTGGRYVKFKASFGQPKLICHLRIEFADGKVIVVPSDSAWRSTPGPVTFSCIYGGEDYDARLEPIGWDAPNFDDSTWKPATITDGPGGTLVAQASPSIRVTNILKPARFTRPRPDVHVYDLGRNIAGYPAISFAGQAGTQITMRTGELLDENGLVTQASSGSPVSFSYTSRGDGVESWQPRFSYTGFRYVQIDGPPPMELDGCSIHSAAPRVGRFSCSSQLFNQIHDLIVAAIASNMQGVLTDCPHREKLGWLEQAHLMGPSIMFNFDVASFYAKISRDIRDAQHDDGCVPTIAPEYVVFKDKWADFSNSPEWGSAAIISPWLVYRRYGDVRILEENYDAMVRYVDYLRKREDRGIIDFGLGDWYDIGEGDPGFSKLTSKALTATAIYFHDVTILQKVAAVLGKNADAERYGNHARVLRGAFQERFFDRTSRRYDRGSQTAQAMPLVLGLVEEKDREAVLERLLRDIRRHDNHSTAGDIGFRFVLTALAEAGRSDVICDLLTRTDPPSYGSQIQRGATTLTEAWDADPRKSQNHLMLGHAEEWFWESLAGIRIDLSQPPADQIVVRPAFVGDISWVAATHESVLGTISIRWERQPANAVRLTLSVPVQSTVILPASEGSGIREGGKPAQRSPGVRSIRVEDGLARVEVESGDYVFEAFL